MKQRNKRKILLVLTLILGSLIISCAPPPNSAKGRAQRAKKAKGNIYIGAVSGWKKNDSLWNGIKLAQEEINQHGGLLGRNVVIIRKNDHNTVVQGQKAALEFTENPDIIAVIGHTWSYISIATSIIYEYYGILMFSPYSTSPRLTRKYLKMVFRNIPDDTITGKILADFCYKKGWKHIIVYSTGDVYGRGLSDFFTNECIQKGIQITSRALFVTSDSFKKDLRLWKEQFSFDAIFVVGMTSTTAGKFIRYARKLKIRCPIIAGDIGLDDPKTIEIAGKQAKDFYFPSLFCPNDSSPVVRDFVEKYKKRYGNLPDTSAEQGYEALMILGEAIKKAKSTVPIEIANTLKSHTDWQGVTGRYSFSKRGNIIGKKIFIKEIRNGKFVKIQ